MIKKRADAAKEDCWNVEALYPNTEAWEAALKSIVKKDASPFWPELAALKGHLSDSPESIKSALETIFSLSRNLSALYTYAHLRHDEDIANDANKNAFIRITSILHEFSRETSWFEPELVSLSDEMLKRYLEDPSLSDYRFHLEKIIRIKKHTLTRDNETLMALAGKALDTSQKTFSMMNDADFKFGKVSNAQGHEMELTHALYGSYIRDRDRILRENAFKSLHRKFHEYENTLCELVNGQVQTHVFNARARGYQSSLEAALFPKNIDTAVYHSLIRAVREGIGSLHKYVRLRRKILQISPLHAYDMYVPLTSEVDIKMTFQEAADAIIESTAPLGSDYQNHLKKGFYEDRWVDRYENLNKRSGGYSSGCYGSMPYILMNYKEQIRDVFTLAHEAGHSMHSLLSRRHQPYHYSDYPIFLAEVASTFNEDLLTRFLLKNARSREEKIFLINQKIEDIRTTLFRQTMFAEFELTVHEMADKNIPLTPKVLKEAYAKLNADYFGSELFLDEELEIEWSRIPHFYYNFYVFQYATGISTALALPNGSWRGETRKEKTT